MSAYPFKCDLCGGVTDAPTYGDFACQHCGQVYVYDECHRIELSERQLKTLRDSRWIAVSERLPDIGVSVLCLSKEPPGEDLVWIGQREQYEWYFPGANEMGEPTHWMPLPEPPEVK